MGTDL